MKKYLGVLVIALLVTGYSMESHSATDRTQLAKCLTKKGWVMYEAQGCKACLKQRGAFGSAFANIETVECSDSSSNAEMKQCKAQKIRYTPTWVLIKNGKVINRLEGNQPLERLAKVSGCR